MKKFLQRALIVSVSLGALIHFGAPHYQDYQKEARAHINAVDLGKRMLLELRAEDYLSVNPMINAADRIMKDLEQNKYTLAEIGTTGKDFFQLWKKAEITKVRHNIERYQNGPYDASSLIKIGQHVRSQPFTFEEVGTTADAFQAMIRAAHVRNGKYNLEMALEEIQTTKPGQDVFKEWARGVREGIERSLFTFVEIGTTRIAFEELEKATIILKGKYYLRWVTEDETPSLLGVNSILEAVERNEYSFEEIGANGTEVAALLKKARITKGVEALEYARTDGDSSYWAGSIRDQIKKQWYTAEEIGTTEEELSQL